MFDFGFSEMIVCALLALIVLGPERLPKLARWIGRFTGQARAYMQGLTAELERESHLADLKRQLADTERLAREHADAINQAVMSTTRGLTIDSPVMTALPAPGAAPALPAPVPVPVPVLATIEDTPVALEGASLIPDAPPRIPLGRQPDLWLAEQEQAMAIKGPVQLAKAESGAPAELVTPLASLPPAGGGDG